LDSGQFDDAVAVVSGGAGAIGRCIIDRLSQSGARTASIDRAEGSGADLDLVGDVTDGRFVADALVRVRHELGVPTAVVSAAGVVSEASIAELTEEEWRRIVDASLTGTFLLFRATVPAMAQAGRGAAVALSSGWGTKGYPRGSHYAAAKAGIEALVKSVALEVARSGVRVNAVAPGPVLTPFLPVPDAQLAAWRKEREEAIPLGRLGEPDDVAGPVLFLLSDASAYVTGQVLHVNGGLLMP
jgi:NAD(P)-dependent dehydrogenase (short-subunit alcohol dehydrogenase family)